MGMLGAYDAHFYCDCCGAFAQSLHANNAGQARAQMRKLGWKLRADGATICNACVVGKPLLPDEERQGGDWQNYE